MDSMHNHDSVDMGSSSDSNMMMHMSFYWGKDVTVLVSSWTTSSTGQYIAAVVATIIFCVLHEFMTTLRVGFVANSMSHSPKTIETPENTKVPLLQRLTGPASLGNKAIGAFLYGINVAAAYIIMLVVMTFNLGLFISVVVGLTVGFFLFGYGRCTPSASAELCCPM